MTAPIHQGRQHRSILRGVEAVTLVSNQHFPRHTHDQFGIGVIRFGAHRSWSGIGHVEATAGDVIMVSPGEMHDGHPIDDRPRGWQMLYFDPELVRRETADEISGPLELVRPVAQDLRLASCFATLFGRLTTSHSDTLAIEESLVRVLVLMLQRHGLGCPVSYGLSPSVRRVRQRLDAEPHAPISLAELAELAGTSRFQLLRGFARETGTTPHAYLVQRRVLLARRLLAANHTPTEAALAAGFADQSHLTRAFVRHLGVTPARYRAAIA
jgi:AraC-like DNA-binding protein